MSRFSGPQQRGAARQLADQRRREAETRQAAERVREWNRARAQAAAPPLLSEAERADLKEALRVVILSRLLDERRGAA